MMSDRIIRGFVLPTWCLLLEGSSCILGFQFSCLLAAELLSTSLKFPNSAMSGTPQSSESSSPTSGAAMRRALRDHRVALMAGEGVTGINSLFGSVFSPHQPFPWAGTAAMRPQAPLPYVQGVPPGVAQVPPAPPVGVGSQGVHTLPMALAAAAAASIPSAAPAAAGAVPPYGPAPVASGTGSPFVDVGRYSSSTVGAPRGPGAPTLPTFHTEAVAPPSVQCFTERARPLA